MTISYSWLCEYLPLSVNGQPIPPPEQMSEILTSVGLEVESMEQFESVPGSLEGLVIGEVLTCEKHPDADKLKVTTVSTGSETLQIVCGAPNVAVGQKVVVAPVGTRIYPVTGDPITMKKAKIRGVESQGMICAEDEIGTGSDHDGIMILDNSLTPGTPAATIFEPYSDYIFEIGLTPNRMDAMSHIGVARDVAAYLAHHRGEKVELRLPFKQPGTINSKPPVSVLIENTSGCKRYSAIHIDGITVRASPAWLQNKLKAIGVNPINNIVDITNFILHETGQPLHSFDAAKINGNKVIVRNAKQDELFTTLDEKERKLSADDLLICNEVEPMCIAGIYGGINSGITEATTSVFLESAWFDPRMIRKSSMRYGLRTDAASRFEKGTDITMTMKAAERAAALIVELAGGSIKGIEDVYPVEAVKTKVHFTFPYLEKISGKIYEPTAVKNILGQLGFEIENENKEELNLLVPFSKPDISLPADIAEEILRIDGLDNIVIPETISISPAVEKNDQVKRVKDKIAGYLSANGFYEIFTNSISNSELYEEKEGLVKMINSLSSELNCMRPSMVHSGLQAIAYNLNRKNNDIRFYEFGKTYIKDPSGIFVETRHLSIFMSGSANPADWKHKETETDFFHLKGVLHNLVNLTGIDVVISESANNDLNYGAEIFAGKNSIGFLGAVSDKLLKTHDIKQAVYIADLNWDAITMALSGDITFREIPKFPSSQRDLALVVDKSITFDAVKKATESAKVPHLASVYLFDIFESEKLGAGKKSLALNYTFTNESKTLTDKDIDSNMNRLIRSYETSLNAEIRK